MLSSLARSCFRHPWRGIVAWLVIFLLALGISGGLGESFSATLGVAGTESQDGADILEDHFGGVGAGPGGQIVFRAEQGVYDQEVQAALTELFNAVDSLEGTTVISPYGPGGEVRIARDGPNQGLTAYADVSLDPDASGSEAMEVGAEIADLIDDLGLRSIEGLDVEIGGVPFAELNPPESEAIGLAFSIFVLILVLGSVLAMGATVGSALLTVGVGTAGIVILSNLLTVPDFAPAIGVMIGLGVGIDYALFIITRYRDSLSKGLPSEQAMVVSLDTAGRSVIFAGATVVVSLLGMLLIGIPFVRGFGVAAAATVAVVMVGSITLLPSLVAVLGDRITTTRVRGMVAAVLVSVALFGIGAGILPLAGALPIAVIVVFAGLFGGTRNPLRRTLRPRQEKPLRDTGWYRLSRMVQARPWFFAIGGTIVLLLLAAPVLVLRFGFADASNYSPDTTTRKAYDLVVDGFGPGANGPLLIVAEVSGPPQIEALEELSQELNRTPGIDSATPPALSQDGQAAVIEVKPDTGPQHKATTSLVLTLRDEVIPAAVDGTGLDPMVTGLVAVNVDVSDFLKGRTVLFFVVVLGASFLLLMAVFRSLMVPLKAVIMNMLSIGAAYGVVVVVFQWGWLGSIVGIEPGPIEPFIPMMLFAVLFGLSMDYEVFLLSRMKEEFERTGDAVNSVADGLAATARVITAAALIMVFIFGSFVFEDARAIKLFGIGLAVAVAVDASLVRMLIVPSTMELLGVRNWWLPGWLDRILPNLRVEGGGEPLVRQESDN